MLILTWPRSLGKSQTFTGEGDTDVLIGSVVDNETFEAGDVVPFKFNLQSKASLLDFFEFLYP